MLNTPVPPQTLKSSNNGPEQYLDGRPPGNSWCCGHGIKEVSGRFRAQKIFSSWQYSYLLLLKFLKKLNLVPAKIESYVHCVDGCRMLLGVSGRVTPLMKASRKGAPRKI